MQRIELDNFRVFGSPVGFDLAPVTVLTGKNNSGKSSLIKSFLVLADYLEQDDQTVLRLDGPRAGRHKISSFEQLANWDSERKELAIGFQTAAYQLTFQFAEALDAFAARLTSFQLVISGNQEELVLKELSQTDQSFQLQVSQNTVDYIANADAYLYEQRKTYSYEAEQQRKRLAGIEQQIASRKAEFDKNPELLKFQAVASAFAELNKQREDALKRIRQFEEAATSSQPRRDGITYQAEVKADSLGANDRKLARLLQQALIDYVEADASRKNSSARFSKEEQLRNLLRFGQALSQLLRLNVVHVGPNRTYQARLFFNHQTGSEITTVVESFIHRGITTRSDADKFLRTWLPRFNVGDSVSVSPVEGAAFKITVSRKGSKRAINLADLGFGAGQILTILLQIASAIQQQQERRDKSSVATEALLLLIEEPEANLHPQFQSALAELFAELAQSAYNLRFVIETHSEYLLRNIQVLVKEQQVLPLFKVYYLDQPNEANGNQHGHEMRLREDGMFMDEFGEGFLMNESANLTFKLF